MLDYFRRLLDYDTWANERALESVRGVAQPSARLLPLSAHIFASKRMWLGRIQGSADAALATWPELSWEETVALEAAMCAAWIAYFAELTEAELAREVRYTTATGDPGRQTVADICAHKFLHAMYHRGQIAQLVRAEGGTPASTDLVVWAKQVREAGAG